MRFTLWNVVDGGYVKMATANSPLDLDELVHGTSEYGAIDELDKSPASQAGGCGFDPHWHHHTVRWTNW